MYPSQCQIYLSRAGLYGESVIYFIDGLLNGANDSFPTFFYISLSSPSFNRGISPLETWLRLMPNVLHKLVFLKGRCLASLKGLFNIELPVPHYIYYLFTFGDLEFCIFKVSQIFLGNLYNCGNYRFTWFN